jgi:hypothetical protein
MATISFGPNLGLINNAAINQVYVNQLRQFLQAIDQLIMGNVINATTVVPPTSPNNGDAYLLTNVPSGAWTGNQFNIAVWTTQFTLAGTNTLSPRWIFYTPKPGWILWNQALAELISYNGSTWSPLGGGANFPTNTDITSMTGIPNTSISSTGYSFNDGTDLAASISGTAGIQLGTGSFSSGTVAQMANQSWPGFGYTGIGIGVSGSGEASIMYPGTIATSGTVIGEGVISIGLMQAGGLRVGSSSGTALITANAANLPLVIAAESATTVLNSVIIDSGSGTAPIPHIGLFGFTTYNTQTTVGAAGSASAVPALPLGYLPFTINGTEVVLAYYAHA